MGTVQKHPKSTNMARTGCQQCK